MSYSNGPSKSAPVVLNTLPGDDDNDHDELVF